MRVEEIMTRHPVYIRSDANVFAALTMLRDLDVRHLPVVDGDELVGIISDRDLTSFSAAELEKASVIDSPSDLTLRLKQSIAHLMSPTIFFVNPESSVTEAIDIMLDQKIGAIPVVDVDNSLVGIVTYFDVLKEAGKIL